MKLGGEQLIVADEAEKQIDISSDDSGRLGDSDSELLTVSFSDTSLGPEIFTYQPSTSVESITTKHADGILNELKNDHLNM